VGIPDEDRYGPAWLRDYTEIETDITAMAQFAAKLRTEVESNYVPHLTKVYDDMVTALPAPEFAELRDLLQLHNVSQQLTANNVHEYANATGRIAYAATKISQRYAGSDAFAHARVTDVDRALGEAGVTGAAGHDATTTEGG
jgi:hypothetical protein